MELHGNDPHTSAVYQSPKGGTVAVTSICLSQDAAIFPSL